MAKIIDLNRTHADYSKAKIQHIDALYCGGDKWRALLGDWLPQAPAESDTSYSQRKARALYRNDFASIIDLVAAMLFSEEPSVKGLNERNARIFATNADRDGSPGRVVLQTAFIDAMRYGVSWSWIRLPASSGAATLKDQEVNGDLDWWFEPVDPINVLDWYEADQRIQWVKVADTLLDTSDPLKPPKVLYRWRIIDDEKIRTFTWTPADENQAKAAAGGTFPANATATEGEPILHGYGTLPIRRFRLRKGMALGPRMYDPAIAAIRAEHDADDALFKAAHALLVIGSDDHTNKPPILGQGHFLKTGKDDRVYFAEPSGNNTKLLVDRSGNARNALYSAAQQFQSGGHATSSPGAMYQSGASKQMDWYAAEAQNASYADQILAFVTDLMSTVAKVTNDPGKVEVTGLEGWHQMDIAGLLQASTLAFDAKVMSPTFQRALATNIARRLLSNTESPETMDAIYKEIAEYEIGPLGLPGQFASGQDAAAQHGMSGASGAPKYPKGPSDADKDGKLGE